MDSPPFDDYTNAPPAEYAGDAAVDAPHAVAAESAVLGSLLLNNDLFEKISDTLKPDFFYDKRHKLIYAAAMELHERGQADPVLLAQRLRDTGKLSDAGGEEYIAEIADIAGAPVNIPAYADLIAEKACLRMMIGALGDSISDSYRPDGQTAQQLLDTAEGRLSDVSDKFRRGADSMRPVNEIAIAYEKKIHDNYQNMAALRGVHVGFDRLYKQTHGFRGGDLVILAGRPGAGKTAFALNVAQNIAAKEKSGVLCFSLEMSSEQIVMRLLSHHGINMHKMMNADSISAPTLAQFSGASSKVSELNIHIDDSSTLNILEARTRARRVKREMRQNGSELKLIMVDYLQLMDGASSGRAYDNRALEVSMISRGLKALARELDVPVLALSQLNRGVEKRPDQRPVMSDLRESGAIEQDADMILFLHAKDDTGAPEQQQEKEVQLIIGKQRNGPVGTIYMTFDKPLSKFREKSGDAATAAADEMDAY